MLWKGFQKPKRLVCDVDTLPDKYGQFSAQPFERGFGTTIGNALRRVLLSSIEGAAITAVKIEGVMHEFSSIPGVVEDATDIILNLKQIPLKMHTEGPKTLHLIVDNQGQVTSRMIQEDADVDILDKEVYIATVSEGGSLHIEMRVKNGRGYVSAEKNFDEDLPIGYIPVDSVHSPIRKVNYTVEAARLGQMTDYDKLTLDVWTNGAVTPQDAIGLAAKLLKDHTAIFINIEEEPELEQVPHERPAPVYNENLDRSVEELELSVRSYNCLKNANITTIRELVQKSEQEMLKTKNFGRKSLNEIKEILSAMGLSLGMKTDEKGNPLTAPGQESPQQQIQGKKLSRNTSHRRALLRNLVTSMILSERIETTVAKAKAARPVVEQMITLGKQGDLHARRLAASYLMDPAALKLLFGDFAKRYAERKGGYTRIVHTGWRKGDGADMAVLELVGSEVLQKLAEKRAKRAEAKQKAAEKAKAEEPAPPPEEDEKK